MRRTELKRGDSRLERRTRVNPVNRKRRDKEWARAYGSIERVFYVSTCMCCAVESCTNYGDNHNAHIETGGMSRKADADRVVPLCPRHHAEHHTGAEMFVECYGIDLNTAALETQRAWEIYGADVVARAKADGRFQRWIDRATEAA